MRERLVQRSCLLWFAVLLVSVLSVGPSSAQAEGTEGRRPVLFVHGGAGSGAQFEAQAMRFASNGYASSLVHVFEYDSQFMVLPFDQVVLELDEKVDAVLAATGESQLDALGHSLGTRVMQSYLSVPERAKKIAHYVNVDGFPAAAPPGGVPTLAVWAGVGGAGRTIPGATNVTIPDQTHVEVATSAEAFVEYYRFFTGAAPGTSEIVPTPDQPTTIAGRAVVFPENTGIVDGSTIAVWRFNPANGKRMGDAPAATVQVGADGAFGPVAVEQGAYYELVVQRPETAPHHFFYEPFPRSDALVRLNLSRPGQGLDLRVERGPTHAALTVVRFKELWGDQGAANDVLSIGGTNVINDKTSPRSNRTISVFAFDRGSDGASDLSAPIAAIYGTPFLTGVDLHIPADDSEPPLAISLTSRGTATRSFHVRAIPSSQARVTVQLRDWED